MQDRDRIVMILVGGGVAIYTGLGGWRAWKAGQVSAAVGIFLLAAMTVALPLALAMFGG